MPPDSVCAQDKTNSYIQGFDWAVLPLAFVKREH
jgi:hypothetical protein